MLNSSSTADSVEVNTPLGAPVEVMQKRYGGSTYVFAAGMRNTSMRAEFHVKGVKDGSAKVLGEGRTVTLSNGRFTDEFGAFGVHIYRIR